MQGMKIRIKDAAHSEAVQKALFAAGYNWQVGGSTIQNTNSRFLFAGTQLSNSVTKEDADEYFFNHHASPEYKLLDGQFFVPYDTPEVAKPPLGLRPVAEVVNARKKEILDAITRYHAAGLDIPSDWLRELQSYERFNRSF